MSTLRKIFPVRRAVKVFTCTLIVLFLLMAFLGLGGSSVYTIELPIHIIFGWALHAWRELPPFLGKWQAAVLPLGCLLVAAVLAHRFIRRWLAKKRPEMEWRIRHTAAVLALLLLCSAAAIAASGIVHQMVWLGQGKFLRDRSRRIEIAQARGQAICIMQSINEFFLSNERYPRSFEEMELPASLRWTEVGEAGIPEQFRLLRPGSTTDAYGKNPVILSPPLEAGANYVVGYGDGSAELIDAKESSKVMSQAIAKEKEVGK